MDEMRVALVHDWLVDFGGAESVVEALVETFLPKDIHTLFYDPENFASSPISKCRIHTTFLDTKWARRRYRKLLPLFPFAVERLKITDCDVVISSSHCVAHGVKTNPGQLHICYCHTPIRYAWDMMDEYLALSGMASGPKSWLAKAALSYIRRWDRRVSSRARYYVSNSNFIASRIKNCWGKEAVTIYPPCGVEPLEEGTPKGGHFIFASRLVQYKRADLVVEAAGKIGAPVRIAGGGPQLAELQKTAPDNVTFLGHLPKDELRREIASARALIFPALEDFGILPVEAQALGTPVIAYGRGGALETVVPPAGEDYSSATGIFFDSQDADSVAGAVRKFERIEKNFRREAMTENAKRFSKERFVREISEFVASRREDR
ncbi:MAG TPA: glycosyltransferase [Acidobacteriota bacterium]|nr:glycosyltransferase [Acidobacteriota bacterium]HQO20221.1 glycosyltransferase [Acidobacteriota bacterium]HQQ46936.1 glycosyltransferase [Acidobacteriota bacterium]